MGSVYSATNSVTGKVYIGWVKSTIKCRINRHLASVKRGSQTAFHRSIRKHGISVFTWNELYRSNDEEDLKRKEVYYIKTLNTLSPNGYNLTTGGDGLTNCTDETRRKIGLASRSRPSYVRDDGHKLKMKRIRLELMNTPEGDLFRKKLSESKIKSFQGPQGDAIKLKIGSGNRGKTFSSEYRKKLSDAKKKFFASLEGAKLKRNLSEMNKGKQLSLETRAKMSLSRTKHKDK